MAKRYTDTDKWKKSFFKTLPAEYKLVWLYILDECDHAGIWHVEMDTMELRLGIKLSIGKIRGFFRERIVEFDGGNKIFVPDFITFQYGELTAANKAHNSVIKILEKYKLKGHTRPLGEAKDKDMDMDKELDMDNGVEKLNDWETAKNTFMSDEGWQYKFSTSKNISKDRLDKMMIVFITDLELKQEYKDAIGLRSHFTNWVNKQLKDGPHQQSPNGNKPGTSEARVDALSTWGRKAS